MKTVGSSKSWPSNFTNLLPFGLGLSYSHILDDHDPKSEPRDYRERSHHGARADDFGQVVRSPRKTRRSFDLPDPNRSTGRLSEFRRSLASNVAAVEPNVPSPEPKVVRERRLPTGS